MAAYLISHSTIKDEAKLAEYVEKSSPIAAEYGAEFITVGPVTAVLNGSHAHKRVAMFKFPNTTAIEDWFHCEAYKALWPTREAAGDFDFVVFEDAN